MLHERMAPVPRMNPSGFAPVTKVRNQPFRFFITTKEMGDVPVMRRSEGSPMPLEK
jgi:hypothetical protein